MKIPPVKVHIPDSVEILLKMKEIMDSGMLTMHKYTKQFEAEFAEYTGTKHAIAVSSGTAALEISLRCIGLTAKDEVIVPTNTFVATPHAIVHAGGKPVFADMNKDSLCADAENIAEKITENTKGVIVVHVGGLICPDIEKIKALCDERGLFLIEDCAHAHGSKLNGKLAGSFGDLGCFSFYPTKVMTAGEGGMITTNNAEYTKQARTLRDQGKSDVDSNVTEALGHSWRLSELHAVLGLHQLRQLENFTKRRCEVAEAYDAAIDELKNLVRLNVPENARSSYYKYIAFLKDGLNKEEIRKALKEKYGISLTGDVYWPPCHLQPIYEKLLGNQSGQFPNAETKLRRHICLPIYATMRDDEVAYVIKSIKEVIG